MRIKSKVEPKAKMKVPDGSAFAIETAPHLPKLHQVCIVNGKRGAGKGVAVFGNLLRMYKETGRLQRLILVSPTTHSNKRLLEEFDIQEEDIFDDPDAPGIPQAIIKIVNDERDEYVRWRELKRNYEKVMKQLEEGEMVNDQMIMSYYNPESNTFEVPEPKYKCYLEGRPPVIMCVFDDFITSKVCSDPKLSQLVLKHRHQGSLLEGGAIGISLFFLIQSYKARNSIPPCIRNQATSAILFRSRDLAEKKTIADSFSGEIDPETFIRVYDEATKDSPHDFLFVDLHHKPNQTQFRRNFDQYLIIEDGVK